METMDLVRWRHYFLKLRSKGQLLSTNPINSRKERVQNSRNKTRVLVISLLQLLRSKSRKMTAAQITWKWWQKALDTVYLGLMNMYSKEYDGLRRRSHISLWRSPCPVGSPQCRSVHQAKKIRGRVQNLCGATDQESKHNTLTLVGSLMEPLPIIVILQFVSVCIRFSVSPRGPNKRPTKLNCKETADWHHHILSDHEVQSSSSSRQVWKSQLSEIFPLQNDWP